MHAQTSGDKQFSKMFVVACHKQVRNVKSNDKVQLLDRTSDCRIEEL